MKKEIPPRTQHLLTKASSKLDSKWILLVFIMLLFVLQGCSYATKELKPESKIKSGKDITMYIATDIHYLSKELTDDGAAFNKFASTGAGKQLGYIGEITEETYEWIKECSALAKEKGAKMIAVMHHNILNHSEVIQEGYTVNTNKKAIEEFQKNNLDLVLSGHIHIQDISSYKKDVGTLYDIN